MITNKERLFLNNILINNSNKKTEKNYTYPLLENGFSNEDIINGMDVLLSKKITMGEVTKKFENEFAKFVGSKYALMVNSGSSANLSAAFAMVNPKKKNRLNPGDYFLIPSLCWPTSLWPFIQAGLKPKFVDVDLNTFCMKEDLSVKDLKKIKAIVNIHILGNCTNMTNIQNIVKEKKLIMLEDTCEALGSKYQNKYLGTFGDFGTFSFYYSHQITSGEGGMVICKNKDDYNIMTTLRAHGWDRELNSKNKKNFNFINSGFNLRPLDLTAAIASNQLKRLNKMIKTRGRNRKKIIEHLLKSEKWSDQFSFFKNEKKIEPSWFGLPLILNDKLFRKKKSFLKFLNKNGIETRPILTGNFLKQPCSKLYNFQNQNNHFKNTDIIHNNGFFIGLPTEELSQQKTDFLVNNLLSIK
jgi:CDP-6-deoxy-D-xylo-4-hexulose-3-dehydrase